MSATARNAIARHSRRLSVRPDSGSPRASSISSASTMSFRSAGVFLLNCRVSRTRVATSEPPSIELEEFHLLPRPDAPGMAPALDMATHAPGKRQGEERGDCVSHLLVFLG